MLQISVITPVYNAEKYLRKSVESALMQSEVKEVVLVEDCSPDNSLEVALQLVKEDSRVKVYQHDDKKNHGAAASRNLGIQKASCEYIAFLDADDFYLPNRFDKDIEIFSQYPDAEGVYSAIGSHYYSEEAKIKMGNLNRTGITTLSAIVPPNELIYVLLSVHPTVKGYFSGDGLLVKKSVFDKVGFFSESLKVNEDTHMWIKMSILCNLYAGQIDTPICLRGVHNENRASDTKLLAEYRYPLFESLYDWAKTMKVNNDVVFYLKNLFFLQKLYQRESKVMAFFDFFIYNLQNPICYKHRPFFKKAIKFIIGK